MLARALFVLVSTISTVSYADGGQLLVKYRGLERPECELAPGKKNSLLYIERVPDLDHERSRARRKIEMRSYSRLHENELGDHR